MKGVFEGFCSSCHISIFLSVDRFTSIFCLRGLTGRRVGVTVETFVRW